MAGQYLCKRQNHPQSKLYEAIRTNCGERFGHWVLKFEIYL
jgi:hypothetical protein